MIVAIHQPNYAPWLGYFHKIARADCFVFLDDAQFSKGSYTNRVQIARGGAARWLTVPVRVSLGMPIAAVPTADPDWPERHLDLLRQAYRHAAAFDAAWPDLASIWRSAPAGTLAEANRHIVEAIAARLGLVCRFERASALPADGQAGDARLAAIVAALAPGGTYLSGKGGAKYQSADAFERAGVTLQYSVFQPRPYDRGTEDFVAGLSVVDALFHLGFAATADLARSDPVRVG